MTTYEWCRQKVRYLRVCQLRDEDPITRRDTSGNAVTDLRIRPLWQFVRPSEGMWEQEVHIKALVGTKVALRKGTFAHQQKSCREGDFVPLSDQSLL